MSASSVIMVDETSRYVMLDSDHAPSVLSHLETYEYAGPRDVALTSTWHAMLRAGGVHAVDVDDSDPDEGYANARQRPCAHGEACPPDRAPDGCEANVRDAASKCPSRVSPHATRRGSIARSLNSGMPDTVVTVRPSVRR